MSVFSNRYVMLMTVLLLVLTVLQYARRNDLNLYNEGFDQRQPFLAKRDADIYDQFYAEIFDDVHHTHERTDFEYNKIIELTRPSTNHSVFLDVGSGTGHLVNSLTNAGYNAHGLDVSKDMIDYSTTRFPEIDVKCGDANDSMVYDKGVFTHITCLNFTLYHMRDKRTFFRNCYHWLAPNGYLILHLVDRDSYNPHSTDDTVTLKNANLYANQRRLDANIAFKDFDYKSSHSFNDNEVTVKETFTDSATQNVRQNELTMYMENKNEIIKLALNNGFVAHAQINTATDEHQFIYIFERLM